MPKFVVGFLFAIGIAFASSHSPAVKSTDLSVTLPIQDACSCPDTNYTQKNVAHKPVSHVVQKNFTQKKSHTHPHHNKHPSPKHHHTPASHGHGHSPTKSHSHAPPHLTAPPCCP